MGNGRGICSLSVSLIWFGIDDGGNPCSILLMYIEEMMAVEEINGCVLLL